MPNSPSTAENIVGAIRAGVIGDRTAIPGPFGPRPLIYADYTASGRALDFIEGTITGMVAPFYANTHSETCYSGLQTSRLREEARQTIRQAVGADERHAVIFTGSGATAAINKLASVIGLRRSPPAQAANDRPVVFVGPYGHHSNELIWRESTAELVRIPLNAEGGICFATLQRELAARQNRPLKIGSFSAASNVTGVKTPMRPLARLLHQHSAWFFADYAAGGPYLPIAMGESAPGAGDHCDAIFLSPHKFIGGPGASGVLVADKRLFDNAVPSVPGGGTVSYVNATIHRYVSDIERREEAGTPAILGDIRAGLVLALKQDLGTDFIAAAEHRFVTQAFGAWAANPAIDILGPPAPDRLAIFSFNLRTRGGLLHPNFVVTLLNDLFGIQARGGCSCAGPYGHDLLGINAAAADRYDVLLAQNLNAYRPGWVRLSFNSFFDDATVRYIISAVDFVARRGSSFLALYQLDPRSGRWIFGGQAQPASFSFGDLCRPWRGGAVPSSPPIDFDFDILLAEAETLADKFNTILGRGARDHLLADEDRWFITASDEIVALNGTAE